MASLKLFNVKLSIPYLIFITISLIGCFYHVIQISYVYFKFQTKIDVSFDGDSQIVVPKVSICRRRKVSSRTSTNDRQNLSPSFIYNMTYDIEEIFMMCIMATVDDGANKTKKLFDCKNLTNYGVQLEKTINFMFVCYTFKHPQFSHYKPRIRGTIYEFMMYHNHDKHHNVVNNEYNLYLTSDKIFPNGQCIDSVKLIGNFLVSQIKKINFLFNRWTELSSEIQQNSELVITFTISN